MFTTTLRQSMWRVSGINQMIYSRKHHTQTRQGFACCVRRKEKNGSLVIKPDMERLQIFGTISRSSIKYILLAKNLSPKLGLGGGRKLRNGKVDSAAATSKLAFFAPCHFNNHVEI